jgi:hypothetical protein
VLMYNVLLLNGDGNDKLGIRAGGLEKKRCRLAGMSSMHNELQTSLVKTNIAVLGKARAATHRKE